MVHNKLRFETKKTLIVLALLFTSGCAAVGVGAVGGATGGAVAASQPQAREYGAGTKTVAVLSNVVYLPAKSIYALGGAVTSGVAYLITGGDRSVSRPIWNASVGGDYLVTPAMVAGDRPTRFNG